MENNGFLPFPKGFSTAIIHGAYESDSISAVPPIVISSLFKHSFPIKEAKYYYGRCGNPTRSNLEQSLAVMEGAKYACCFSSGMGATTAVLNMLKKGDHLICDENVFATVYLLFEQTESSMGISASFVNSLDVTNIENAIKKNTKLIWIENPTNPLLKVLDIQRIADVAHKHNILLAVDNTFLTPYLQRPLNFGADLVVHSISKYINGHTDIIMGAVVLNDEENYKKILYSQKVLGNISSPYDCSQVSRSLKTLSIRIEKQSRNALIIAQFLETHPNVITVLHPGMPSHPQHELFKRQTSGHSGVISFYIKGKLEDSQLFINKLKLFFFAGSLGGCGSSIQIPTQVTHAELPKEFLVALEITDNLLRISVGLEDVEDLIADLKQALDSISKENVS